MMKSLTLKRGFGNVSLNTSQTENGFTLLELLIAVLIGSIVIAVVGSLFLANSNTFRAVDDTSRLQENGRFALQTISRITRQAGFIPADITQLVASQNDAYPAGFISGTNGTNSANNYSDTLTIAFRPASGPTASNGQIVDCAGATLAAPMVSPGTPIAALPAPITNVFYVAASSSGGGNSLYCDSSVAGVGQELINGVESFQVLYAIDAVTTIPATATTVTKQIRDFAPDYFTSANNLDANKFNAVLGVQIALVLRGAERSTLDKAAVSNKIYPFGKDSSGNPLYTGTINTDPGAEYQIKAADDRRTFRAITSTINIRNRAA